MTPAWEVVNGDALDTLKKLRDGCVHMCVTSPPYYGLRDYGVEGQVGVEGSPEEYITRLVTIFREIKRVLRDDGTLWVNIGDSYASTGGAARGGHDGGFLAGRVDAGVRCRTRIAGMSGLKPKDMIGIPWMLAFALRADGWYLRNDIIWHKPNAMPSSVTDRLTNAHEHVLLLSKSGRYFYDHVAIQEDAVSGANGSKFTGKTAVNGGPQLGQGPRNYDSPKRNRRDVWTIASQPFKEAHFAVFPPALVEPCIMAGTSEHGVCATCGAPYKRIVEHTAMVVEPSARREEAHAAGAGGGRTVISGTMVSPATTTTRGFGATCLCGAVPVPAIVVDPFCGSGTTGVVSTTHGRCFIGIDLNGEYCAMARRRIEGVKG